MRLRSFLMWIAVCACVCNAFHKTCSGQQPLDITPYLYDAKLDAGIQAVESKLKTNKSQDDLLRLGVLQFFGALQGVSHELYEIGKLENAFGILPIMQLDLPENNDTQPVTYLQFREIFQRYHDKLAVAEKTLAQVTGTSVRLKIDIARIHLDVNGNGRAEANEQLMGLIQQRFRDIADQRELLVDFDQSDAIWLQGYCNLAMALTDFMAAIEYEEAWNVGAAVFFPKAQGKYDFVGREQYRNPWDSLPDLIATIHQMRLKVVDRQRMQNCRERLLKMVTLSRQNWAAMQAETDDELEWIPNAKQSGFIPRVQIQQQMIATWFQALDEWEAILEGQKLIKFWRGNNSDRGVNLKRVFDTAEVIDPVLWIQGSGAWEFLEEGNISRPESWREFQRVFQGNFAGFAIWFN